MEEIIEKLREFRDERDWKKYHSPKNLAVSISIEAAELLELFQWLQDTRPIDADLVVRAQDEVADVFIYLVYFCDAAGIDLLAATEEKVRQNQSRYTVASSAGIAGPSGRQNVRNTPSQQNE